MTHIARRHPLLTLGVCGLLSLALYGLAWVAPYDLLRLARARSLADIGIITGYSPWACGLYVAGLLTLYGLYGVAILSAWYVEADAPRSPSGGCRPPDAGSRPFVATPVLVIAVLGVAMAVALCFVYPYAASDVFLYIVRGRVLGIFGRNSMLVPPSSFPTDAYLPFPSEWSEIASPYGPLWEWIAAALARLGDGGMVQSLLAFKLFGLLVYLSSGVLIASLLRRRGAACLPGLVAFAWNPLVLVETHANGHNDLFMAFFVLLAVWCWQRERYAASVVAVVLGGLVKWVPMLLLPVMAAAMWAELPWRRWLPDGSLGLALGAAISAAIGAPLWPGLSGLGILNQASRVHTSVCVLVAETLGLLTPQLDVYVLATQLLRVAGVWAYVVILERVIRRRLAFGDALHRTLHAWLLFGAVAFGYWYIVWLMALCPLLETREARLRTIVFSATGILCVAIYTFGGAWVGFRFQYIYPIVIPFVFVLPLPLGRWLDRRLPAALAA